jgi:hypothetical protein
MSREEGRGDWAVGPLRGGRGRGEVVVVVVVEVGALVTGVVVCLGGS